ncbi:MAG TPA: hypothetical protein VF169_10580 [Albitalea sp.]|uniref:hypothetical protein n=1 Tax=Piscinibacter sp. TaxID=1903157 RepID=UPI002ED6399B
MATNKLRRALTLTATMVLAACARAPGPAFSALDLPPTAYGRLYVYRPSIWFTAGMVAPVKVGTVREGELHDGSYLNIRLAPGRYIVDVNGVVARVAIVGGANHFLEFDLSRSAAGIAALSGNQLATSLTERGELHPRSEHEALPALRLLRDASAP